MNGGARPRSPLAGGIGAEARGPPVLCTHV